VSRSPSNKASSSEHAAGRKSGKIEETPSLEYHDTSMTTLDDLSKLLDAAHNLMKQDKRLDAAAFEYLRRLRMKVRFAQSAAPPKSEAAPPPVLQVAPKLFSKRDDKRQGPLEFTKDIYGPWLGRWVLSRADIRQLDKKLYHAYGNWGITSEQLDEIGLPTKEDLLTYKLDQVGPMERPSTSRKHGVLSEDDVERLRLWSVAAQRNRRSPG
jgi:hypothetical protein